MPTETKEKKLTAYAPFELNGKQYKKGEAFIVPASFKRDTDFDQFRQITKRADSKAGIAFYETLPPLTPKGEPQIKRHILPLEES